SMNWLNEHNTFPPTLSEPTTMFEVSTHLSIYRTGTASRCQATFALEPLRRVSIEDAPTHSLRHPNARHTRTLPRHQRPLDRRRGCPPHGSSPHVCTRAALNSRCTRVPSEGKNHI